jgi:uncharacterized protein (DUF488 family)
MDEGHPSQNVHSCERSTGIIWTVGHSNRSFTGFLELLVGQSIELVADVRRFNSSLRNPQFGRAALAPALEQAGIDYRHFEALGGRRGRTNPRSPNQAWKVGSFNAYADHMATEEFKNALAHLTEISSRLRVTMMCAEALPWRCHRRLIADALVVRGWQVLDIYSKNKRETHSLTPFAKVSGFSITYPKS